MWDAMIPHAQIVWADALKFDMKFTKGNTIVSFGKLWHLQKMFALRYAEQGGAEFNGLIDRIHSLAARYTEEKQLAAFHHPKFNITLIPI